MLTHSSPTYMKILAGMVHKIGLEQLAIKGFWDCW